MMEEFVDRGGASSGEDVFGHGGGLDSDMSLDGANAQRPLDARPADDDPLAEAAPVPAEPQPCGEQPVRSQPASRRRQRSLQSDGGPRDFTAQAVKRLGDSLARNDTDARGRMERLRRRVRDRANGLEDAERRLPRRSPCRHGGGDLAINGGDTHDQPVALSNDYCTADRLRKRRADDQGDDLRAGGAPGHRGPRLVADREGLGADPPAGDHGVHRHELDGDARVSDVHRQRRHGGGARDQRISELCGDPGADSRNLFTGRCSEGRLNGEGVHGSSGIGGAPAPVLPQCRGRHRPRGEGDADSMPPRQRRRRPADLGAAAQAHGAESTSLQHDADSPPATRAELLARLRATAAAANNARATGTRGSTMSLHPANAASAAAADTVVDQQWEQTGKHHGVTASRRLYSASADAQPADSEAPRYPKDAHQACDFVETDPPVHERNGAPTEYSAVAVGRPAISDDGTRSAAAAAAAATDAPRTVLLFVPAAAGATQASQLLRPSSSPASPRRRLRGKQPPRGDGGRSGTATANEQPTPTPTRSSHEPVGRPPGPAC